tara:strand:- start:218 stop:478 length:261 start_codon:yes stop_codon:yes gene_type:complete
LRLSDDSDTDYDGVTVRVIAPKGRAPRQYMSTQDSKGRGRRGGSRRGNWLTENDNIRKQKEIDKKNRKRDRREKNRKRNRKKKRRR